jgi:hypothetical protein
LLDNTVAFRVEVRLKHVRHLEQLN